MEWLFSFLSRFGVAAVIRARRRARQHWQRESPERLAIIATDEVFPDPGTGRMMRVWIDPNDGTRLNVPVDSNLPPSE